MSVAGLVVRPLFDGFIDGGLQTIATELRHSFVKNDGTPYASQTNLEYAVWLASQLGSLGTPTYKGNNGTTDASGIFAINTPAFSLGNEVIVLIRRAAGGAGGDDDEWGSGVDTISAA